VFEGEIHINYRVVDERRIADRHRQIGVVEDRHERIGGIERAHERGDRGDAIGILVARGLLVLTLFQTGV
jgi:hypothetical protein